MGGKQCFDAIVVGSGILGACAAYHLLERGAQSVAMVDQGTVASGTSGAGAGFVGLWAAGYADFWGEAELALQQYGLDFYRELAVAGQDTGLRLNGNLFLALGERGWKEHVEVLAEHPLAPSDVQVLERDEVEALSGGLVRAAGIHRAVLHPRGLQVSTGLANAALVARVRALGGTVRTGERVRSVALAGGAVQGVRVEGELLSAGVVVVAAGVWTNRLLASVDRELPLLPICASRVETVPCGVVAHLPTLMFPEIGGLWVREHQGGLTYGNLWGYQALHTLGQGIPARRPRVPHLVEAMRQRLAGVIGPAMPALLRAPVSMWTQGLPCHTPDRRFLVGAVPDVPGLYVLAGDNEAGFTHGPGLGRLLADVVTHGHSELVDPRRYRLDRFPRGSPLTPAEVAASMPRRR